MKSILLKMLLSLPFIIAGEQTFARQCLQTVPRITHGGFGHGINVTYECVLYDDQLVQNNICAVIFRHGGFSGATLKVKRNVMIPDLSDFYAERRTHHGGINPHWSGSDVTWEDINSSVKVAPGCTLVSYEDRNVSSGHKVYAPGDYSSMPDADQMSSLSCQCGSAVIQDPNPVL